MDGTGKRTYCSQSGCTNTFDDHQWGRIKAQGDGWFFQKDGKHFCAEHVPEWVPAWRARQEKKKAMATSTLRDVYHAIENVLLSNPELGEAHATYQQNEDGSITIKVAAMEGVTK